MESSCIHVSLPSSVPPVGSSVNFGVLALEGLQQIKRHMTVNRSLTGVDKNRIMSRYRCFHGVPGLMGNVVLWDTVSPPSPHKAM